MIGVEKRTVFHERNVHVERMRQMRKRVKERMVTHLRSA